MTTTPSDPVQDPAHHPVEPEDPEKPHGDPLSDPDDAEAEPGQMPDHDTEVGA
jgi:hypothetical protein